MDELHSTNNFPEFTGKLCPAPCESACVLGLESEPVIIRTIESSIIERGFQEGWVVPQRSSLLGSAFLAESLASPGAASLTASGATSLTASEAATLTVEAVSGASSGKSVAIIGSGPAGLAAAQQLRRFGHQVTVFEKSDQIGGLLRYGIPDFKMEKSLLDRRLEQIRKEGVEFKTGIEVGTDISAQELRASFHAICLTTGAEQARPLEVPGQKLEGVHLAMDFLTQQNRINAGQIIPEGKRLSAAGKHVVILGGGDTGADCLGTVHRQGAQKVTQLERLPQPPSARSSSTPWPSWPYKLRTSPAHDEGGERLWKVSTLGFSGNDGKVEKLHAIHVDFKDGLFKPIPGSELEIQADLVLLALGFTGTACAPLLHSLGLETDTSGNIPVDAEFKTKEKGVFAAGDAKRGASLIVWAIAEGRKMASSVHHYLEGDLLK